MPPFQHSRTFRRFANGVFASLLLVGALPSSGAHAASAHDLLAAAEQSGINTRYLLIGPDGGAVSDDNFRGKFQLITFGYTYCPDVCPTTLAEMALLLKELGHDAERLQAIFISVDPERDTPTVLKTYTPFFDPRILGLTGSTAVIKRIAQNYKVRYAKVKVSNTDPEHYVVDHTAGMFLLGPDGLLIRKFAYGRPIDSVLADLKQAMRLR